MASMRSLLLLVGIFAVLAIGYFMFSGQREALDTSGGYFDLVEGTLSSDEVFGIEAMAGGVEDQGFRLAKKGEVWVMSTRFDAKANLNKIRTLLGNLESLEGELRSDDASVLADYALDDASALHLRLKKESGEDLLHLLIGSSSGSGGFVRFAESNRVLLANKNLRNEFGMWSEGTLAPDAKSWLDLEAFKAERTEVSALTLVGEGRTLAMRKEFEHPAEADSATVEHELPEYEWRVTKPDDFVAMKTRADGILGSLSNIRARDVAAAPTGDADYGLGEGADRIEVELLDGSTRVLQFGGASPDDETLLYFKVEGESSYWLVPDYIKRNLFKDPEELRPS